MHITDDFFFKPDVAIVRDPNKPLDQDNIEKIVAMKFDDDIRGTHQNFK